MIALNDFDEVNCKTSNFRIEIHQSVTSSRDLPNNAVDQFSETNSTVTSLHSSIVTKTEQLNFRKELLLKKRNAFFDSFLFRFFKVNQKKINIIDNELDQIEEEIILLNHNEFKRELLRASDLIKKTSLHISKYKSEINENV